MSRVDRSRERAHADPGLQPERTALAWGRTCLALFTAGMFQLRFLPDFGVGALGLALVSAFGALVLALTAPMRYRDATGRLLRSRPDPAIKSVLALSGLVTLLGVGEIVLLLRV